MAENHGGAREGAGRKPKADELKILEKIKDAVSDEDFSNIWKTIGKEAKGGSIAHIKILFEYFYGKPKESVDVTTKGKEIAQIPNIIIKPFDESSS